MTTVEPFTSRWKRRARTIPLMLGATAIGLLASPAIVAAAAAVDVIRRRFRLPTVRVVLFLLQYGINDSIEILLAPIYWTVAGLGTRLDGPRSIARHQRLQSWSIDILARRAERLLGLRLDIDPDSLAALAPGPVIVLCRHVNIVDASLATLLYQRLGYHTRGVIMAELLADPGFDLIYARTGSVFVPRDNGPDAIAMVRGIGHSIDTTTAVVIFPEGRLFRSDALERAKARLTLENPERARRLAPLEHVLPPRPGGVLALLDSITADIVVIAHTGLTSTHRSPTSPKPFPSATPSESPHGDARSIRSRPKMACASRGWTNSGFSSSIGSHATAMRVAEREDRPARLLRRAGTPSPSERATKTCSSLLPLAAAAAGL